MRGQLVAPDGAGTPLAVTRLVAVSDAWDACGVAYPQADGRFEFHGEFELNVPETGLRT